MSNWTHVAAVVRIDSMRFMGEEADFEKVFGKTLNWTDDSDVWRDANDHPDEFLPLGSEGSLQMSVWTNPDEGHVDAYTVSIFGDLRDHDDPDEIITWFRDKVEYIKNTFAINLFIRQAVITVDNECNGCRTWTYEEEWP